MISDTILVDGPRSCWWLWILGFFFLVTRNFIYPKLSCYYMYYESVQFQSLSWTWLVSNTVWYVLGQVRLSMDRARFGSCFDLGSTSQSTDRTRTQTGLRSWSMRVIRLFSPTVFFSLIFVGTFFGWLEKGSYLMGCIVPALIDRGQTRLINLRGQIGWCCKQTDYQKILTGLVNNPNGPC